MNAAINVSRVKRDVCLLMPQAKIFKNSQARDGRYTTGIRSSREASSLRVPMSDGTRDSSCRATTSGPAATRISAHPKRA
jgi:hypothetical protein